MSWLEDNYGSMAGVDDPSQGPKLAWSAEAMADWTSEDHEAAELAMARDMADKRSALERENEELRSEVASLRKRLGEDDSDGPPAGLDDH